MNNTTLKKTLIVAAVATVLSGCAAIQSAHERICSLPLEERKIARKAFELRTGMPLRACGD